MTATDTWTPGDPLYDADDHPHSMYVFNFRDEPTTEECHCGDAASWPKPRIGRVIEDDPLEGFISAVRAMRTKASDAAQACEVAASRPDRGQTYPNNTVVISGRNGTIQSGEDQ